ncbi:DUF3443 domain-containing protein [Trinickia violacea]|uniref:DUF3443 domain-containing protein n=1 Tax=Trinickia violacea TaxID=2571746 RepID=A0A4P8INV9_9BURK|nr:DUF3443 domain-containing protein [Trinickia violacea]QCP49986.1 DUF3443 domain-containing protein [Trinickia violacea]
MLTRTTRWFALGLLVCGALAGCGGGGSSGGGSAASAGSASPPSQNTGGGNTSNPADTTVTPSTTPNVQPIVVASTPSGTPNMLMTSVTVCAPSTSQCQTIDNIQVDTGSYGLRILASALTSNLALPAVPSGSGAPAAECAVFGSGYTWGAVRSADVRLASELATAIPIQVIADASVPTVASDCAQTGAPMQDSTSLRANGILGIGLFGADCGNGCANSALPRWYYACPANGACAASAQPLAQQVSNPVSQFATDNNGVIIDLPAVADLGAASVSGSMIFGIGSQHNNALGNATVLQPNADTIYVTSTVDGATFPQSFFDTGSNGLFFSNASLPQCSDWYCPSTEQRFSATFSGTSGGTTSAAFSVANQITLFATGNAALGNLAGPAAGVFDWGLPFFYGRRIFTAIEGQPTPAGLGPYYAF